MDIKGFINVFDDPDRLHAYRTSILRRFRDKLAYMNIGTLSHLATIYVYSSEEPFDRFYQEVCKEIGKRITTGTSEFCHLWEESEKGYDVEEEARRLALEEG